MSLSHASHQLAAALACAVSTRPSAAASPAPVAHTHTASGRSGSIKYASCVSAHRTPGAWVRRARRRTAARIAHSAPCRHTLCLYPPLFSIKMKIHSSSNRHRVAFSFIRTTASISLHDPLLCLWLSPPLPLLRRRASQAEAAHYYWERARARRGRCRAGAAPGAHPPGPS